jgi:hypothetical protein
MRRDYPIIRERTIGRAMAALYRLVAESAVTYSVFRSELPDLINYQKPGRSLEY